jgi:hypothetical protein
MDGLSAPQMGCPNSMMNSPLEIRFLYVIDHRWIKAFTWQGAYNNRLSSLRDSALPCDRPSVDKGFHMARCSLDLSLTPKDATSRRTWVRRAKMRSLTKRDGCCTSPTSFRRNLRRRVVSYSHSLRAGSVFADRHKRTAPSSCILSLSWPRSRHGVALRNGMDKTHPSPIHTFPYVVYTYWLSQ